MNRKDRKEELTERLYTLELTIAEALGKKRKTREELNALLREEAEVRRRRIKEAVGLSKKEHAAEGGFLTSQECRDLCWSHHLPYVSCEIIGHLISAGRIDGHQYKGGYFATKDAVMQFIEQETADPDSEYFELPEPESSHLIA